MNAFEKLLKLDKGKLSERQMKVIPSKRLAFLFGDDEGATVKIRALSSRDIEYVNEFMTDTDGNINPRRLIDGNALICSKAIVEPNVNDAGLIAHFGAADAKDLCEKIFEMEMSTIASEVMELSGASIDTDDVKN